MKRFWFFFSIRYKSNEEYVYVRGRGRGKYICEECGIRCKKPSMLKKHIRTHTDVRPYICKCCNFAFKTKGWFYHIHIQAWLQKIGIEKITPVLLGNLTKHMKSKAHMKKCLELGVSPTATDSTEDAGKTFFPLLFHADVKDRFQSSLVHF